MEKGEVLIRVENVSKKFCRNLKRGLWYGISDIARNMTGMNPKTSLRKDEFWAVKDISFEVRRGECLALIGHNGAGKSTLLKMLNGLIRPDAGRIEMRGKIGALIELGAGFNPVLSGRDNVYANGAVLGFSKEEIDRKFDDIVAFAEIENFIDMPVQNYSSGMKVRLGFGIASQMEPDILLIDEVLAVGDLGFKIKCFNEIYRIIERSAVILVSHSMPQVAQVCKTGMVMKDGKTFFSVGKVTDAIITYYDLFNNGTVSIEGSHRGEIERCRFGDNEQYIDVTETSDQRTIVLDDCDDIFLETRMTLDRSVERFSLIVSVSDVDQKVVSQIKPPEQLFINQHGVMTVNVYIKSLMLNTGNYTLSVHVFNESDTVDRGEILIGIRNVIKFSVKRSRFVGGAPILYEGQWEVK